MYPNPTSDYTVLQINQDVAPLQLQITDGIGRTILNQPIAINNGQYTIYTSLYSSGLYYVALYTDKGKIFGGKLNVVNK